jgi:hypothetical protein
MERGRERERGPGDAAVFVGGTLLLRTTCSSLHQCAHAKMTSFALMQQLCTERMDWIGKHPTEIFIPSTYITYIHTVHTYKYLCKYELTLFGY